MTSWTRRYKDSLHDSHPLNCKFVIGSMYSMPAEFVTYTNEIPEIPFDTYPEDLNTVSNEIPEIPFDTYLEDLNTVPNGFSDNCPKAFANISVPPWYIGSIYQGGIIRPVTAPFQHYETGVQVLKFKRYSNTRPSTR